MKVLLVGSGGREHAIGSKLVEKKGLELFIAPGNAGLGELGKVVPIRADNLPELVDFALKEQIELCVVGPEVPLCLGLVDELRKNGVLCFGPTKKAAQIEGSKAFSKRLMRELGIPTASYRSFTNFEEASQWINANENIVIKQSGLASGKGVFLPQNRHEALGIAYELLSKKDSEIVIEERLEGEEISLLAFCDGDRYLVMPSSQDHKRLLEGNLGENTGGMGAVAPVPGFSTSEMEALAEKVIAPVVRYFKEQGAPYVGVLYAGLMVSATGPKVLEYNCRFGDPETEALMALFTGDLAQTMYDCARGRLDPATVSWSGDYAVTVIMADEAYPQGPTRETELKDAELGQDDSARVFHCGTARKNGKLYSNGGRVLAVTATARDLPSAVKSAYNKVNSISFPHSRHRLDIASQALAKLKASSASSASSAYDASGVDIDAGNEAVRLIGKAVKQTYTKAVLSNTGSFGGLFDCADVLKMKEPVLVASTDGVGTKVKLAASVKSYASVGMDIVNHCVDDILVQGAKPLFFLDYFATSKLNPRVVAEIVSGMSEACVKNGCALIGGETAEMPGVYLPGEFDIAGTIVGVVEREKLLPKAEMKAGDVLVGFASDSPHTNGYSLIRKTFEGVPLSTNYPELNCSLEKALLTPHKSYLPLVYPILQSHPSLIKGLAHITGGGFYENIPRILPAELDCVIDSGSWEVPALYKLIEGRSKTSKLEMYRVFNQGIGLVAVVSKADIATLQALVPEKTWVIGELVPTAKAETRVKIL